MSRRDPDRRVEQDEPLDALRRGGSDLVGDRARRRSGRARRSAASGAGLEHVGDVLLEVPRRLPRRARRARAGRARSRGSGRPAARRACAKWRPWPVTPCRQTSAGAPRLAPLVAREAHSRVAASGAEASSVRRRVVRCSRGVQTTMPVLVDQERAAHRRAALLVEDAVGLRGRAVRPEVGRERVARAAASRAMPAVPGAASHETRITSVSALSKDGRFACRSSASSSQTGVQAKGWKTSRTFRLPRKSESRTRSEPLDLEVERPAPHSPSRSSRPSSPLPEGR